MSIIGVTPVSFHEKFGQCSGDGLQKARGIAFARRQRVNVEAVRLVVFRPQQTQTGHVEA
jgi:hypothetical protein